MNLNDITKTTNLSSISNTTTKTIDSYIKNLNVLLKPLFVEDSKLPKQTTPALDLTSTGHPFHLVKNSPKPILASFVVFLLATHLLQWMTGLWGSTDTLDSTSLFAYNLITKLTYISFITVMYSWFWYLHFESTFLGKYTSHVKTGLNMGIQLFIVSEVMFFVGAFWAYLHGAFNPLPCGEIGSEWPLKGINFGHWYAIPTVETCVLVSSGFVLSHGYNLFLKGNRNALWIGLMITIFLALYFLALQYIELSQSLQYSMPDSFFSSSFYFGVGCHACHVFLGTCGLIVALVRHIRYTYAVDSHVGLNAVIWYWNFVDFVWILLYGIYYVWGS